MVSTEPVSSGRAALDGKLPRRLGQFAGTAWVFYLVCSLLVKRPGGEEVAWFDLWLHNGLCLFYGALSLAGANRQPPRDRLAWRVSSAALLVNGVANFSWVLLFDSAALSPADSFFLAFYPLMYAAVVLLARGRAPSRSLGLWLDGGIAGFGVAALMAAFVFPQLLTGAVGEPLEVAVNLAYPLADLLLIVVLLAGLAPAGWRPDRPLMLLIGGLAMNTAADAIYLLESASGSYDATSVANLLWIAAFSLMGMAAWARSGVPRAPRADVGVHLLLPALAAVAAAGLLVVATRRTVQPVAVGLAALTLACSASRVALAFRELRALALSRLEARTDELTGLPNRRSFVEALEAIDGRPVSVLLLDLDGFKEVNDTLGHEAGDRLLVAIGSVLREVVAQRHVVARLGGDEFAVLLCDIDVASSQAIADQIRTAVNAPLSVGPMSVSVGASIGISNSPTHTTEAATLLRFADIAMYQAKRCRAGVEVFGGIGDDGDLDRLQLAQEIRQAIQSDQIVLHYQPKVQVDTGEVQGTEALARWQHPTRGLLMPATFLPLVEHAGLCGELTRLILGKAVSQLADWADRGIDWTVSVNIFPGDLLDESLPRYVASVLDSAGAAPSQLVLEITEEALLKDPARAARTVRRLRDAGTQISLDDFGVGFSSLLHLRSFDLDELKLDRTLVTDLECDSRGRTIVRTVVHMAESLGLRLVVEGIETQGAGDDVAGLGVRFIQGYLYGRPMEAADLETWADEAQASNAEPASDPLTAGRSGERGSLPT